MAKNIATSAVLRESTPEELDMRLNEAKQELFSLRVKSTTKELSNPNLIKSKRREIARINTIMNEKNKGA